MSKHHKNQSAPSNPETEPASSSTDVTEAPAEQAQATQAATADATPAETVSTPAMDATASDTAIVPAGDDGRTMAHLIPALPHLERQLRKAVRVTSDEFDKAIANLPEAEQDAISELLAAMNPDKVGRHVNNQRSALQDLKIHHGTGDDPNRPKMIFEGNIYAPNRVLCAAEPEHAKTLNVPQIMVAAVVGVVESRTYFEKGEGDKLAGKAPICRSLDRTRGDKFGDCAACPYRPWKVPGEPGDACSDDVQLFLVIKGFKGFFRMIVKGTSVKPGAKPVINATDRWTKNWQKYIGFSTRKNTNQEGTRRWYELTASVLDESPSPAEDAVLSLLGRQFDTNTYYPGLAQIYRSSQAAAKPEGADPMQGLLAGTPDVGGSAASTPEKLPDYSSSKNNM